MKRLIMLLVITASSHAHASWSWGSGYHNPPRSTLGVNVMRVWEHWAAEAGAGLAYRSEPAGARLAAAASAKYLFTRGFVRPYVQAGADHGGEGSTDPFAGAGFYMMGFDFYLYFSVVYVRETSLQLGFGVPL
ncbi:MAG TPA: hypothetical protein VFV50_15300 [Bdellovibrionales bacterium]|nr:hypothetical protein [Bdellovibrionales bacterium]